MAPNADNARDALFSMSPDMSYDDWLKTLMAAHAADLPFETCDEWCASGSNYDPRVVREKWRSFERGKGTGPGTLFYMAKQFGGHTMQSPMVKGASALRKSRHTKSAAEVWERCVLATDKQPYVIAKQGVADGLRVVPEGDPLRLGGESMVGALVVPVGDLSSLQLIAPPEAAARLKAQGRSGKLNLPGHSLRGWFAVGKHSQGSIVYLCEGIGQAWACWRATGRASLVCFGWGRVRTVATELKREQPGAQLVIVADSGKEEAAQKIAREVGAQWVEMPSGWPNNSDVNDLAQRDGYDVLEVLLSAPLTPSQRFKLLTAEEMASAPAVPALIKATIPAGSIGTIIGAPGTGKTYLTSSALLAISEGEPWFGLRTKQHPVLYIGLEGAAGLANRVRALRSTGHDCGAMRFMSTALDIRNGADRAQLIEAIKSSGFAPVAIAIDTLAQSSPGADENSGQDMGEIIAALTDLRDQLQATVIAVHHVGKDASKGPRGHSSFLAALDFAIEVRRDGDHREWQVIKAKDASDGDAHSFVLRTVELGEDEDGDPITSCVVHELEEGHLQARRPVAPSGGNQRLAWLAVNDLIAASQEFGRGEAPPMRKCITLEAAIEAASMRLACDPKRRRERSITAITGLASRGCIGLKDEVIWLI